MSTTPFRVRGIVWTAPDPSLPEEALVDVPNWLTDLGEEDFEPDDLAEGENSHDHEDGDDDDDDDDEYEPSDEASAAFEAEWQVAMQELLEQKFGVAVASFAGFGPA